jgi:hypothetical protein
MACSVSVRFRILNKTNHILYHLFILRFLAQKLWHSGR